MVAGLGPARKIKHSIEVRANKISQVPSCEYSMVFGAIPHFSPAFFPEIRALGGQIVPVQKKFPQHVSPKLLIFFILTRRVAAAVPL